MADETASRRASRPAVGGSPAATPEAFFEGHPGAAATYRRVRDAVAAAGDARVVVSRSQVAFWRRRGFAYLWLPGRWLRHPGAEVVLSIALDRRLSSSRFKEVVHPGSRVWMHHLEVADATAIDEEVVGWLRAAWEAAA